MAFVSCLLRRHTWTFEIWCLLALSLSSPHSLDPALLALLHAYTCTLCCPCSGFVLPALAVMHYLFVKLWQCGPSYSVLGAITQEPVYPVSSTYLFACFFPYKNVSPLKRMTLSHLYLPVLGKQLRERMDERMDGWRDKAWRKHSDEMTDCS
jgi:hypothetical protein